MMNKREWMLRFVLENPFYDANNGDTIGTVGALYDAIVAATPDLVDEGWIEHRGEKPYPEGMVDIELRGGIRRQGVNSDDLVWTHDPDEPDGNILFWRPARA